MTGPLILHHDVLDDPANTSMPPLSIALDTSGDGFQAMLERTLEGEDDTSKRMRASLEKTLKTVLGDRKNGIDFIHQSNGVPLGSTAVTVQSSDLVATQLHEWDVISRQLEKNAKQVTTWWNDHGSDTESSLSKRGGRGRRTSVLEQSALVTMYTLHLCDRINMEAKQYLSNIDLPLQEAAQAEAMSAIRQEAATMEGGSVVHEETRSSLLNVVAHPFRTMMRRLSQRSDSTETRYTAGLSSPPPIVPVTDTTQARWRDTMEAYFGQGNYQVNEHTGHKVLGDFKRLDVLLRTGESLLDSMTSLTDTLVKTDPKKLNFDDQVTQAIVEGVKLLVRGADPTHGSVGDGSSRQPTRLQALRDTRFDAYEHARKHTLTAERYSREKAIAEETKQAAADNTSEEIHSDVENVASTQLTEKEGTEGRIGAWQISEEDWEATRADWELAKRKMRSEIADMSARLNAVLTGRSIRQNEGTRIGRDYLKRWLPTGTSGRGWNNSGKRSRNNQYADAVSKNYGPGVTITDAELFAHLSVVRTPKTSAATPIPWRTTRKKGKSSSRKEPSADGSEMETEISYPPFTSADLGDADPDLLRQIRQAAYRINDADLSGLDPTTVQSLYDGIADMLDRVVALRDPDMDATGMMDASVPMYRRAAESSFIERRARDDLAAGEVLPRCSWVGTRVGRRRNSEANWKDWDAAVGWATEGALWKMENGV